MTETGLSTSTPSLHPTSCRSKGLRWATYWDILKESLCILGNHRNWHINQLCSGTASKSRSWHGQATGGSSQEQLFLAWLASSLKGCLVRWDSGSFVPSSEFPPIVHLQRETDCAAEWLRKNAKVGTGDHPSWRPLNWESLPASCCSSQVTQWLKFSSKTPGSHLSFLLKTHSEG